MKIISETENKYNAFKERVIRLDALRTEKEEELAVVISRCSSVEKDLYTLTEARVLLEKCNIVSRDFVRAEVEQLVTQSLRSILDNPFIKFEIEFVEKRNQTEALFSLAIEGDEEQIGGDIISTYGGGVVDIISVSLRVIMMQLLKLEGPLILDEPGKNIAPQYVSNFGKFLTEVSKAFNRQIIMITHNDTLASCANNIIRVEQKNGVSKVEKVE